MNSNNAGPDASIFWHVLGCIGAEILKFLRIFKHALNLKINKIMALNGFRTFVHKFNECTEVSQCSAPIRD